MTETLKAVARRISETPDEVLLFSFSLLSLVGLALAVYWFYNRRKMHQLSHQIPASVVKNYLDSIIQNSSALKSSLFRGGGLELGEGIPSVVPVGELPSGNVPLASGVDADELNQRLAEIAKLTKRLAEKDNTVRELEDKLREAQANHGVVDNSGEVQKLKSEIARLEAMLDQASSAPAAASGSGDDEALRAELENVKAERDDLKERLMEYEIIEEDLANLKRLQQENEQLKRQLAGDGAPAPAPAAAAPVAEEVEEPEEPAPEPVAEAEPEPEASEMSLEDEMAAAIAEPPKADEPEAEEVAAAPEEKEEEPAAKPAAGDQKSAEELLSEFEKMLG